MRYPDVDIFLQQIGKRLKELRAQQGISQRELGLRSGLEKSEIQRLERGGNTSFKTMLKVVNALDIDFRELFDFSFDQDESHG